MENKTISRMIVKFGTANLCGRSGKLQQGIFNDFAGQIVELQNHGIEVIIVSSGAIKAGIEEEESLRLDTTWLHKKDLAGIGARHLMNKWGEAFRIYNRAVAQVWVTSANFSSRAERRSIRASILNFLKSGIIPVLNENDVVSDREIQLMDRKISENDRLARMLALLIAADAVLFLTDEGGIYQENPKSNPDARMYKEISARTKPESIGISHGTSANGTGGMRAKFREASRCARRGMAVAIAGNERNVILRFANGEAPGTKIGAVTKLKQ